MKISNFALGTLLLALVLPQAWACRRPAVEQFQRENDAGERKELQRLIADTTKSADLVFVARVVSVDSTPDKKRGVAQYSPKFELLKVLKGSVATLRAVSWEEPLNSFHFPCGPIGGFHIIELDPTYRYLVFVRAGKIIHARKVIDWPQEVPYEEELKIVRKHLGPWQDKSNFRASH